MSAQGSPLMGALGGAQLGNSFYKVNLAAGCHRRRTGDCQSVEQSHRQPEWCDGLDQPVVMDIEHHFGGKCYAKAAHFDCGDILVQHKHSHEHLSILAEGDRRTSGWMVFAASSPRPACLTIAAGKHHGVKALTDGVWYCIHATDSTDPDEIDHEVIAPDSTTSKAARACWSRCVSPIRCCGAGWTFGRCSRHLRLMLNCGTSTRRAPSPKDSPHHGLSDIWARFADPATVRRTARTTQPGTRRPMCCPCATSCFR
jgi:hypothetical protein